MAKDFELDREFVRKLRVRYPAGDHKITLRTELDWDADVAPTEVTEDGTCWHFEVKSRRPALYFKSCLHRRGEVHWSVGANSLLLITEPDLRPSYPHFFGLASGSFTDKIEFDSHHLNRRHRLRVYLPRGYHENTLESYRVMYTQDGQNLFFPEEAFLGHEWKVDGTLETLNMMSATEDVIVVGVYSEDRMEEYTYPGYEAYGKALVEEVKPYVDRTYRTLSGPTANGAMGSSLGGVVSFYLGWEYPQIFQGVIAMSSTFSYKDNLMERVLNERYRKVRFYLDSGWPGDNYEVTVAMVTALIQRGWIVGKDLFHLCFPRDKHNELAWGHRLHIPAQLFAGVAGLISRRTLNQTQPMPRFLNASPEPA